MEPFCCGLIRYLSYVEAQAMSNNKKRNYHSIMVKSDERHETIRHEHSDRRLHLRSEVQNMKFLYEIGRE